MCALKMSAVCNSISGWEGGSTIGTHMHTCARAHIHTSMVESSTKAGTHTLAFIEALTQVYCSSTCHKPPLTALSRIYVWQGFCIVLMLTAASVFGLILGQLQETFAVANQRAREMEDHIDSIFTFLQENKLKHAHHARSAVSLALVFFVDTGSLNTKFVFVLAFCSQSCFYSYLLSLHRVPPQLGRKISSWIRFRFPIEHLDAQVGFAGISTIILTQQENLRTDRDWGDDIDWY